jgi:hypothetical protein
VSNNANDLLMSGGIKAIPWKDLGLGAVVIGTIVDEPKVVQMRKYESTELDFWPSGDPKMQIVVTIQTEFRDAANAADEGKRQLHIPPRMMGPVRDAVQRAGAKGLAIGGRIAVKWSAGSGVGEGNAREFEADYAAPAVDPGALLPATPVQAAPAVDPWALPPASPVQAAPLAAAPVQPAPVQAAPLLAATPPAATSPTLLSMTTTAVSTATPPAGVDPAVWAGMPEGQRQAVLAAMAPAGF